VATASTGGCVERRKLYTDRELVRLRARAWIIITSANPLFGADGGLADRVLVISLDRRIEQTAESALFDQIDEAREGALSFIAEAAQRALADTKPVPEGLNRRHPDWGALAVRLGRAIGTESWVIEALRRAEIDKAAFVIENHPIFRALKDVVERDHQIRGSADALLQAMIEVDPSLERKVSATALGRHLLKHWSFLETMFIAEKTFDLHRRATSYYFARRAEDMR